MKLDVQSLLKLILSAVFLMSTVGCIASKPNTTPEEKGLKVGLLVEGNIFDQSWDSLAYQTLRKIERELNAEVFYYELLGDATDLRIEEKTIAMIHDGHQLIFGHGAVFQDTFNRLGPLYPDVSFIFFNGVASEDNVYAINFAGESIGFFAGIGAALMTEKNVVGVITAYSDQPEYIGFQAGVNFINPEIIVKSDVVGNWGDRERGKQLAYQLIDQGADVLIGFGDGFNIEVINAAREMDVFAIGFLTDQSFIARDTVLYSVTQNVEDVYMAVVQMAIKNQLQHKPFPILDFDNGGQNITPFSEMVPTEAQQKIKETLDLYKRGKINIQS